MGTSTTAGRAAEPPTVSSTVPGSSARRRRVPLRSHHREHSQLRERLHVRQQGRAVPRPAVAGVRLAAGRQRGVPVHGVHQRARLSGHEPVRHLHHAHHAPQDRLGRGRFAHRAGRDAVVDRDEDVPRLQGPGRGHRPAQDQVGRPEQEHLVLGAARLAFGPVDEHDRPPLALTGRPPDRGELAGDREGGASAAAQIDPLGHPDQLLRGQPRQLAEDRLVSHQVYPPEPVQAGGQPGLPDGEDLGRVGRHHEGPGTCTSSCPVRQCQAQRPGGPGRRPCPARTPCWHSLSLPLSHSLPLAGARCAPVSGKIDWSDPEAACR